MKPSIQYAWLIAFINAQGEIVSWGTFSESAETLTYNFVKGFAVDVLRGCGEDYEEARQSIAKGLQIRPGNPISSAIRACEARHGRKSCERALDLLTTAEEE